MTLLVILIILALLFGGGGYYGYRGGYYGGGGLGGILGVLLVILLVVWLAGGAHAQIVQPTAETTTIKALPWYQQLEPFLNAAWQALVAVGVPILAAILYKYTGIQLANSDRAAIQNAAANAAGRIIAGIEGPVSNIKFTPSGTYGNIIAAEVEHIRQTLPSELERRSITPDKVAGMITGKLGQIQNGTLAVPHP